MSETITDNQSITMENKFEKYADCDNCPIRRVLDRFGDKWSLLILSMLGETDKMRFSEMREVLHDISQKMLTLTLRKLEEDGLVARKIYAEVPPRVEYKLTECGISLLPHILALIAWGDKHMTNRKKVKK